MRTVWLLLVSFVLAGTASSALGAKLLVLESSPGLAWHKGDLLDAGSAVELPAGALLALIDEAGQAVTINGPFKGVAEGRDTSGGPGLLDRLKRIIVSPSSNSAIVLGAMRGPPPKSVAPEAWLIDAMSGHLICVETDALPVLWRSDSGKNATALLRRVGTSEVASLSWPANQNRVPWPANVARVNGAAYEIRFDRPAAARYFTLRVAPKGFTSDAEALVWLWDSGCRVQAAAFIRGLVSRTSLDLRLGFPRTG